MLPEINGTNHARKLHTGPRHSAARREIRALVGLRGVVQPRRLLETHGIELLDLVDDAQRSARTLFLDAGGYFFFVKLDQFLDSPRAIPQSRARGHQLLQHNRTPRNGLEHQQLPALDALGDRHFALARQKRRHAHFPQINPYGIVGDVRRPRRRVHFGFFAVN